MDAGFSPYARYEGDRPSRLILFPHTSYETFSDPESVGRESEWLRIANILHWTLSYLTHDESERVLLLQPDSAHFAENLAIYVGRDHIITLPAMTSSATAERADFEALLAQLLEQPESGFDVILATGVFSRGASERDERALLDACRRVLKADCALLATFQLRDQAGAPVTATNILFLDNARQARFDQEEIRGCQGIAKYLDQVFWDRLRA